MITMTPIGEATLVSFSPLGRVRSSSNRPTGSGKAATSRRLFAIPVMRDSFSSNRSSIGSVNPIPAPATMSLAFSSWIDGALASMVSAMVRRHLFFSSVLKLARRREAKRARLAKAVISSVKLMRRACYRQPKRV